MRTFSCAIALGQEGDVAGGRRRLVDQLEELRRREALPARLLELWEIGLVRYDGQFRRGSTCH